MWMGSLQQLAETAGFKESLFWILWRSHSHDSPSDTTDLPIGSMPSVSMTFLDRFSSLGTRSYYQKP